MLEHQTTYTEFKNFSTKEDSALVEILLQVMNKGDKKAFDLLNKDFSKFETFFREACLDKGNKWDDIIVKFEWLSTNHQYE
jgi:hypothetical protein